MKEIFFNFLMISITILIVASLYTFLCAVIRLFKFAFEALFEFAKRKKDE